MLIVLSPAKSLDYETPVKTKLASHPELMDDAAKLIKIAKNLRADQLSELMDISSNLAELNVARFHAWSRTPKNESVKPAVLAFNGDVYEGLQAPQLSLAQSNYLQEHVRILSGLYGVLRPYDLMQAYRLEMGTQLQNAQGNTLYSFWGGKVTEILSQVLEDRKNKTLVNLASEEYFKVVKTKLLPGPVITPIFKDWKNGQYKIISFYAKRARGLMARYCALHKVKHPEKLKKFDLEGYAYYPEESDQQRWIFRRKLMD
ncbi:peroxide stress protein YaaA [Undibacterium sp. Jales W-56]|uniref:peroxide stress protein YaaA n=1 Tax=Undibacterium sp. Jales W-56 TaxID=2897325 RepID=UPI0021D1D8E5|nr:peroxide stress protein YaaA [Undibacterium sp. Jales W-56]MCU6433487.1 peroxide stress protein YaaA [Undibacterium sp. Jales W-56]